MIKLMIFWLLGLVALLNAFVIVKLAVAFKQLKFTVNENKKEDELPTVSVCITARNETHAMTQCLERVVASEYPKMEVVVLDDGSRDDTSVLIKSFAQSGVRFVEGKPLPDGWLGKNYAQSVLASEASGKLVLFLDVDTLIDRHTVMRMVRYMQQHDASMVSVIPMRNDQWHFSTVMATLRYFWTVMRFRVDRPRAAANAWIIERQLLLDRFAHDQSLPMSMEVETTIARHLASDKKYRLTISSAYLGLRYEKRWSSQIETSIRLLYPQCKKHILQVFGLIVLLVLALLPYILLFLTPWALVLIISQYLIAYYYLSHVWARYRAIGALLLPVILIQEIALLIISTYRYNFGTITWKGRPITAATNR